MVESEQRLRQGLSMEMRVWKIAKNEQILRLGLSPDVRIWSIVENAQVNAVIEAGVEQDGEDMGQWPD